MNISTFDHPRKNQIKKIYRRKTTPEGSHFSSVTMIDTSERKPSFYYKRENQCSAQQQTGDAFPRTARFPEIISIINNVESYFLSNIFQM